MHRHAREVRSAVAALAAVSVTAVLATSASAAGTAFSGKVCGMVTAKQAAAVHVKLKCKQQKTVKNSGGTLWTAVWGPATAVVGPRLSVGVWKVSNPALLAAMKASHASGKSVGIGSWSRESGLANGGTADGVTFVIRGYLVLITLATPTGKPLATAAPLIALAKAVANRI